MERAVWGEGSVWGDRVIAADCWVSERESSLSIVLWCDVSVSADGVM